MAQTISAGKTPRIKVEIGGDLSVVGWDGADILIKADDDDFHVDQNNDVVTMSCGGDMSLRVPKNAAFEFQRIGGDASIRGVMGNIELKEINGDLSIRDSGSIAIDTIRADFSLRNAKGNLYIKNAHSDVSIRDVEGSVILESVADDLALRGARGNVNVNVGEDVVVYLDPRPDGEYYVNAGDDILLVLPPNTNATLNLHGDRIDIDLPGFESDEDVIEQGITLGNGSAKITLNAGGDIRISNDLNAGNSADEFGNFAGLNFDWSGFGERISRQVEQATRRAAQRAEEAARRAERHAERHARKWNVNAKVGRWNWDFNSQNVPPPPTPPSEPVAEEERMAILKMLAEKKITAAQAEELLAALEGGK
jgi:hypothetical protein